MKQKNTYNLLNHSLLVFKYYVYMSRGKHILNIDILIYNLIEIKKKEKRISLISNNKTEAYNEKMVHCSLTFYVRGLILCIMKSIPGKWEKDFCFVCLFIFTKCNIFSCLLFIVSLMFCYILIKLLNHIFFIISFSFFPRVFLFIFQKHCVFTVDIISEYLYS